MLVVYDTETCGIPDFRAPSDAPTQPHLVQLAMATFEDDGTEVGHYCVLVKPDGWTIPADVVAVHGITTERATAEGVPEADAARAYADAIREASLRVAHNERFDRRIMRIAMLRSGMTREQIELLEARPAFDTCAVASPIVNLPPTDKMVAAGFTKPKPPKLAEAIKFFFDEELVGGHDALVDVRACARIYFHLAALEKARTEAAARSAAA